MSQATGSSISHLSIDQAATKTGMLASNAARLAEKGGYAWRLHWDDAVFLEIDTAEGKLRLPISSQEGTVNGDVIADLIPKTAMRAAAARVSNASRRSSGQGG